MTDKFRFALELGRRLAQANVIAQSGDVFWLNLDEIRDPILAAKVAGRLWSKVNAPCLLPVSSKPAFWWGWIFPTPELRRHLRDHSGLDAGLVADLGGPLAHGSIAARECGIPAVMGAGSATQAFGMVRSSLWAALRAV